MISSCSLRKKKSKILEEQIGLRTCKNVTNRVLNHRAREVVTFPKQKVNAKRVWNVGIMIGMLMYVVILLTVDVWEIQIDLKLGRRVKHHVTRPQKN